MDVKIKVSYKEDRELAGVIRLLSPAIRSWRISKNQSGQYKKAYIWLKV